MCLMYCRKSKGNDLSRTVKLNEIKKAVNTAVKANRKIAFVDYDFKTGTQCVNGCEYSCYCGIKTGLVENDKFNLMFSRRYYVHWYVGEGMDEMKFSESSELLNTLKDKYIEVNESETEKEMNRKLEEESED